MNAQPSVNPSATATTAFPAAAPVMPRRLAELALAVRDRAMPAEAGNADVERFLRGVVDAALTATLLFDADGRVVYANRAAQVFAGTLDPLRTEHPLRGVADWHPDLLPDQALRECREHGAWTGEVAIRGAGERERVVLLHIVALGANRDAPFGLTARDVTRELKREEELHQRNIDLENAFMRLKGMQEQAIQSEKLASIGQLAAGVAHEINNPIGYIKSNLNSLQQYVTQLLAAIRACAAALAAPGDAAAAARVEHACRSCDLDFLAADTQQLLGETHEGIDRVCKIVRDLKDFSRHDSADAWVRADIHEGLESTLNIVWNELKYKAQVVKTYGDLPLIECLPSELNQVFMNLLINAGQAIKTHGIITVSTEHCGDNVRICIGDDGEGIPAELLPRIFDPFFTTKPVGAGTGLGLAISYGIVTKHHGAIDVTSAPGLGTMFRIELPVSQVHAH